MMNVVLKYCQNLQASVIAFLTDILSLKHNAMQTFAKLNVMLFFNKTILMSAQFVDDTLFDRSFVKLE